MKSLLLNSSSSQKNYSLQLQDSINTKKYLQNMTNNVVKNLQEIIGETDPKAIHEKIIKFRQDNLKQLQQQNRKLLEENKSLKKQNEELKSAKQPMHQQTVCLQSSQNCVESQQRSKSDSSKSETNSQKIGSEEKRQSLEFIKQTLAKQKQQGLQSENQLIFLSQFCLHAIQKVKRIIQIQKISKSVAEEEEPLMISISREKYNKLFEFYVSNVNFKLKIADKEQQNCEQNQRIHLQNNLNKFLSAQQLEKMFSNIHEKSGFKNQWDNYLNTRRTESQNKLIELEKIAQTSDNQDTKKFLDEQLSIITQNQKTAAESINIKTSIENVERCQSQIQEILFQKLKKIMIKLPFESKQYELFNHVNLKRKYSRLVDIDKFVHQFQNKQDLYEISNYYTNYLLQTINSLMIKSMEILTNIKTFFNQYPWFVSKLVSKSEQLKPHVFQVMRIQFSQYLQNKNPEKNSSNPMKQRKRIQQIKTPKFDPEKKLEKQLLKVVEEYKLILKSSIFCSNKETKIELKTI